MTTPAAPARPTYRERQRAQLREEIERAALRLFAEHGYDGVTTDAIATEVGISLSTFFRHVPSKEDLLVGALLRGRQQVVANFAARPAEEPVATGLGEAILLRTRQFAEEGDLMQQWRTAMASAPAAVQRASFISPEERAQLVTLVADRLGTDPVTDLCPGVLVHVVLAAAEHAYQRWLDGPSTAALHQLTADALACAGAALSDPAAGRSRGASARRR